MEKCTERALKRDGHKTLLIDDKRATRVIGRRLTQRWALTQARRFNADFVFLGKCQGLDLDTVATIVEGKANSMWYHDPQWYKSTYRPEVKHVIAVGKLTQTFFVSGFEAEWRALGVPAKFLPSAADRDIRPVPPKKSYHSDVSFIGSGYDPSRAKGGSTYTSDRTWMVILAGGFYLGHGTPGLTEMLREGDHCAWYTDIDSCLAKIEYYLKNSAARERIRRE